MVTTPVLSGTSPAALGTFTKYFTFQIVQGMHTHGTNDCTKLWVRSVWCLKIWSVVLPQMIVNDYQKRWGKHGKALWTMFFWVAAQSYFKRTSLCGFMLSSWFNISWSHCLSPMAACEETITIRAEDKEDPARAICEHCVYLHVYIYLTIYLI